MGTVQIKSRILNNSRTHTIMQLLNLCALLPMVCSNPMSADQMSAVMDAGNTVKNMVANWYTTSSNVPEDDRTAMDIKYIELYENHYDVLYDVCYRLADFDGAMKDKSKLTNFLSKKVQLIRAIIAAWNQMNKVSAKNAVNVLNTEASAAKFAAAVQAKMLAAMAHATKVTQAHNNKNMLSQMKNTNMAEKIQDKPDKVANKGSDDAAVNALKEARQELVENNAENVESMKEAKIAAKEAAAAAKAASRAAKLEAKMMKACANKGMAYVAGVAC